MENIFEKATRQKLRFNYRGLCSVEALWDIPLQTLDAMYVDFASDAENTKVASLLGVKTGGDEETALKIEIIKHIVSVKLEERNLRETAAKRKEQKQKILELIQEKQDESMRGKSVEELTALLGELE